MQYDDPIKISKSKEDCIAIEKRIAEYLRQNHHAYISALSSVTPEYIKLVDKIMSIIFEMEDPEELWPEEELDEEAAEVLKRMTAKMRSRPAAPKTIKLITDALGDIRYESFLEETAEDEGTEAEICNNRANAKREMGRYEEALEGYNRACELEPANPGFFSNRAFLFLELKRKEDALKDAMHIFSILRDEIENFTDFETLSGLFSICEHPLMATACLLRYIRLFNSLLPFAEIKGNEIEIIKDGHQVLTSLRKLNRVISEVQLAELLNSEDAELGAVIDELKNEIAILRVFGNF